MKAEQREVAGIYCGEVLASLSDYVDGDLDAVSTAQIEAHLAGCNWCECFGTGFGGLVARLRDHSRRSEGAAMDRLAENLRRRLDAE